jgi:hypothetical protein
VLEAHEQELGAKALRMHRVGMGNESSGWTEQEPGRPPAALSLHLSTEPLDSWRRQRLPEFPPLICIVVLEGQDCDLGKIETSTAHIAA